MKGIINIALFLLFTTVIFSCKENAASAADATMEAVTAEGTIYTINPDAAQINWQATKPGTTHNGTINLQSGELVVKDNQIAAGTFVIDMNTITNLDLEGDYKTNLETHLKGTGTDGADDFFSVTKYPTGKFEIVSVTPSNDNNGNAIVKGNLTIKGISKEIDIPANITITENNLVVTSSAFTINRTDWGIVFMSKNVFKDLGDKFVDDNITLQLMLEAKPETSLSME